MTALPRIVQGMLLVAALGALGCNGERAEKLPEWTPADHDHQGKPTAGQVDTSKKRAGMEELEKQGINDVVFAAWKTNCVVCHGVAGRGDGPQGRMVRPPDMTSADWQRTRLDEEMKRAIKKGRGKMPAFGHLPDKTVDGLVQLIRMLGPKGQDQGKAAQQPVVTEATE